MKNRMRKSIKVGITKSFERVTIDINIETDDKKLKTTTGGWVETPISLFMFGHVRKNGISTCYGQTLSVVQDMINKEEFTVLYHTKEYLLELLSIWEEYNLNKYWKYCDHQDKNTIDGTECPICKHKKGANVFKVIPNDKLSFVLKSDWERRFEN